MKETKGLTPRTKIRTENAFRETKKKTINNNKKPNNQPRPLYWEHESGVPVN